MSLQLQDVLKRSDIWQASNQVYKSYSISTGYQVLDEKLHSSGWPLNRLTEILVDQNHIGETQLVLSAIAKTMQGGGFLFLIEPPFTPYAPAWLKANIDISRIIVIKSCEQQDWLWAAEQVMATKGVSCCLFWPPKDYLSNKVLKRLQLAAEKGSKLNFIFRNNAAAKQSSPASLRLVVKSDNQYKHEYGRLDIEILKQSGGWSGQKAKVNLYQQNNLSKEKNLIENKYQVIDDVMAIT